MKKTKMANSEDIFKVLLKNGLKVFPKKFKLFRKELKYM